MTGFVVSDDALSDLGAIWLFIARDNPAAADRLLDQLHDRFLQLAEHPLMGRRRPEFRSGAYRSFTVGNYVIFYAPTTNGIHIARVLHGSRYLPDLIE